jgi:glycosyltransferase involved in cell wall biosynthesis
VGDLDPEPWVSIVIPTRNEENDIEATLECCLGLDYSRKEILVVDDSTDQTPERVRRFAYRGVRLVRRPQNDNGCCGARNLGMTLARGEIVVLLNADNRPRPDLITRVLSHYRNGADCLVVRSAVANAHSLWARYLRALELEAHQAQSEVPRWSEGFSVRKAAAVAVGYIPGDFPLPFCRDNALSPALMSAGFNRHYDPSIELPHVAPDALRRFWQNRVWRGTMAPLTRHYLWHDSLVRVTVIEVAKVGANAISALALVPGARRAWRRARLLGAGLPEALRLLLAATVDVAAYRVGGLRAIGALWMERGSRSRRGA